MKLHVITCNAVIYGETGATNDVVWWHMFLSLLSDVVFVATSGYGTIVSPTFRQHIGSTWVDVSRVGCIGSAWFGVSRICCVECFCTLLSVVWFGVVCLSISIDYNAVCKGILETFAVLLLSLWGTLQTNIDRGNLLM